MCDARGRFWRRNFCLLRHRKALGFWVVTEDKLENATQGLCPRTPGIYRIWPPAAESNHRSGCCASNACRPDAGGPKRKIPGGLGDRVPQDSVSGIARLIVLLMVCCTTSALAQP